MNISLLKTAASTVYNFCSNRI